MKKLYYNRTEKQYFRQKGKGCFGIALANYFIEIGNPHLPMRVYYQYFRHPLVNENGSIFPSVIPRVIFDVTYGRFDSFSVGDFSNIYESARYWHSNKAGELLKIFEEEISNGRIRQTNGPIVYEPPALICLGQKEKNGYPHVVVDCGDDFYVEDGRKLKASRDKVEAYKIKSVTTLRRIN